jgi:endonuclease/exonuclease/phosphatase family metal-dependent hydrolase
MELATTSSLASSLLVPLLAVKERRMKIKIASFNIHKGFSFFGSRYILHELKDALHELDADIVLLQEVVGENTRLRDEVPNWVHEVQSDFIGAELWPHRAYGKNAIFDHRNHGNAILSKFPITKTENISLTNYKLEQRGLLHCEIEIPNLNFPLHVFNVHLDLTSQSRKKQLNKIIEHARAHVPKEHALLLGGDFNDWTGKLSGDLFQYLELKESSHHHSGDHARSFPSFFPILKLDRIYFRKLILHASKTAEGSHWSKLSDHLPLIAEFKIEN